MTDTNKDVALSRQQIREVDRRAIEEYEIPGIVLMENAAKNVAKIILDAMPKPGLVAVVCGRGNNGGDGFAIARHLTNAGLDVEVFLACDTSQLTGDAGTNYHIVRKMQLKCHPLDTLELVNDVAPLLDRAVLIVDAVLGTGFAGEIRSPLDRVTAAINAADAKVVAVDIPSGFNCDSGTPSHCTVCADITVTFVARKIGFNMPDSAKYTGQVHVVDIGAPRTLVQVVLLSDTSD